jgi:hypothetical protein
MNANFDYIEALFNSAQITGAMLSASAAIALTQIATGTPGGIVYGNGSSTTSLTAAGTSGQPLLSNGASAPAFGTLDIAGGGTGLTTVPANGKLLIGNGTDYTLANITSADSSVTITNGAGSIDLSVATAGSVQHVQVALSQSDIQNMNGSPKQIIAAPGAGKTLIIFQAFLSIAAGTFGGGGTTKLQIGSTDISNGVSAISSFGYSGASVNQFFCGFQVNAGIPTANIQNLPLKITNTNAAFTGGSGGATLDVWYAVAS